MDNTRVYRMTFASVYPHYVTKVERKGRTKEELHTIIHWLTGYTEKAFRRCSIRSWTSRLSSPRHHACTQTSR